MELHAGWIWKGHSYEEKPEGPEVNDGQIFQAVDGGGDFARVAGEWVETSFTFDPATRKGIVTTDGSGLAAVVFDIPFVSDQYTVAYGIIDPGGPPAKMALAYTRKTEQTAAGFGLITRGVNGLPEGNIEVTWIATLT
jgi:hypothetical protein